jgi:glycosyltransferase involved in cell wall biosynthesis
VSAKVAIVQDWLATEAGSEWVTVQLSRLLPSARVYTTFFDPAIFGGAIDPRRVHTWRLTGLVPSSRFRSLLPLYPVYFGSLDLRRFDLVISSSVAFTHGVRTSPAATHIAYVHTPMRYAWDMDAYLAGSSSGGAARVGARALRPFLKRWDRWAARRPGVLVANSGTVRNRIARIWGREAEVIYPPVQTDEIPPDGPDEGFFLVAARMLGYRRLDHAVEACGRLDRELVVVGDGPERSRLESLAGPSVRFLGRVDRQTLITLFARCHAYLVPGIEDFGIAPVEAMAAGKPVVGFRGGGVSETVIDGVTGVLYEDQSPAALISAIERLGGLELDREAIRNQARRFDSSVFRSRWLDLLDRLGVDPRAYSVD